MVRRLRRPSGVIFSRAVVTRVCRAYPIGSADAPTEARNETTDSNNRSHSCGIDRHEIGSCAGATGIEKDKHTAEENQQRAGDREIVRDVATRTTTAG